MMERIIHAGSFWRWRSIFLLWAVAAMAGVFLFPHIEASPFPKEQRNDQNLKEKRRQRVAQVEMIGAYGAWLRWGVGYIITDEEKATFKGLTTDDEREQFIAQFWERRNPNPGSPENAFQQEYYRRIAFANQTFSGGIKGWKTDRGRTYILYGPPDEIESHPNGGTTKVTDEKGSTHVVTIPFEDWKYRCVDGIGKNLVLEFVDPTRNGEYHQTVNTLGSGLVKRPEPFDTICKSPKPVNLTVTEPRQDGSTNQATHIDLYVGTLKLPVVKFKDLQAVANSRLSERDLRFSVVSSFFQATEETVLTAVAIQVPRGQLKFKNEGQAMCGGIEVYGQVVAPSGRIVSVFEKELALDVPEPGSLQHSSGHTTFQQVLPLRPAIYKLSLVLKDAVGGEMGSVDLGLRVPHLDEQLSASPLILADHIELLSATDQGHEQFVIGGANILPNVCQEFTRDQNLEVFSQVSDLVIVPQTQRPSLSVQYAILHDDQTVMKLPEDPDKLSQASVMYTIDKRIPLKSLDPGKYTLRVTITDNVTQRTISPSATFQVIQPVQAEHLAD